MAELNEGAEGTPPPSRLGQQMKQPISVLEVALMCLAATVLLAVFVTWIEVAESRFQARASGIAEARVVGHYIVHTKASSFNAPIYEFRTADGQVVRLRNHDLRISSLYDSRVNLEGDRLMLRYVPVDPRQADVQMSRFRDRWDVPITLSTYLMVLFGVIFGLMSYIWVWSFPPMAWLRMAWRAYRLSRRGIVVEARIGRIERVEKALVEGIFGPAWVIETHGVLPETGESFDCRSDYLKEDPHPYIAGRETLPVLVDPKRPERNLLIAEFLPLLPDFGLRARADAIWKERQAGGNAMA
jgi:hypothetical protein